MIHVEEEDGWYRNKEMLDFCNVGMEEKKIDEWYVSFVPPGASRSCAGR